MIAREISGKDAANYAVPRFAYSISLGLFKGISSLLVSFGGSYSPTCMKKT